MDLPWDLTLAKAGCNRGIMMVLFRDSLPNM